ncbi:MAG: hypothetical protein DRQ42_03155 [Gammaproteobacteria bacterium]|nr:MAG: hypothetical protein DRQ42_03155 [Gammaproteobacteria bacterium]
MANELELIKEMAVELVQAIESYMYPPEKGNRFVCRMCEGSYHYEDVFQVKKWQTAGSYFICKSCFSKINPRIMEIKETPDENCDTY